MKRIYLALVAALAVAAVAVPVATATPFATVNVSYSADSFSATLTSSKGVSHYDVTLCDGTTFRVELSGETRTVNIGPFASQIVSVAIKSGRTKETFLSGFTGDCGKKPPPPPPDPK